MVTSSADMRNISGFTLVELLIAVLMSVLVALAIYKNFGAQQDIYIIQDQVVEMQQNLRAGLEDMAKEIRMAGYDPTGNAGAGFVSATATTLHITMDLNGDGDFVQPSGDPDAGEDVTYSLYTSDGVSNLGRKVGSGSNQSIAPNISAIEFFYTLDNGTRTTTPGAADLPRIRCVQITLLARSSKRDKDFTDTKTYTTSSGVLWPASSDGHRQRVITAAAKCRNMEFK